MPGDTLPTGLQVWAPGSCPLYGFLCCSLSTGLSGADGQAQVHGEENRHHPLAGELEPGTPWKVLPKQHGPGAVLGI